MFRMRIKSFGPVQNGCKESADGFFNLNPLTIFIGTQGAGKSTVAKLFSSLVWVEKAVLSGKKTKKEIEKLSFLKSLLSYHRIESYLTEKSEIEFEDDFVKIKVAEKKISIAIFDEKKYVRPRIQYMPSERNLVGVIDRFAQIPLLPDSMQEFLSVYDEAINDSELQNSILPVEDVNIRYNKRKSKIELYKKDYSVSLNEASSGFQSVVPLFLVTKFFSDSIKKRRHEYKFKNLNEQKKFIRDFNTQISALMKSYEGKTLEPFFNMPTKGEIFYNFPVGDEGFYNEPKTVDGDTFSDFLNRNLNSCFYNIVEEPELNLFPNSQKNIVLFLLECLNVSKHNMLIVTTHSPYVLETINNSMYAAALQNKSIDCTALIAKKNQVPYDKVSAYVIKGGEIQSIKADDIHQIDPKEIDGCSEEINDVYTKLSDMEYSHGN